MKRSIATLLALVLVGAACADGATTADTAAPAETTTTVAFRPGGTRAPGSSLPGGGGPDLNQPTVPADAPDPITIDAPGAPDGELPVFLFLFTHTEDPFNHELSEERYTALVPAVQEIAADNPDAHLTWTVMFQGSDARTVAERNPSTGVADLLQAAEDAGVVEFGYHSHHDPTYNNRPQNDFDGFSTWEELVSGMDEWISCRTDLVRGGCIEPGAGGLLAIESLLGDVSVASGLFVFDYLETGAGVHAYRKYDPDRMVGFGFPDHGPIISSGLWDEEVADLLGLLSPAWDTSPSLVWIDDIVRISGGSAPEGIFGINTIDGARSAATTLASVDRDRVQFFNTGIASKFHYTDTSPTIYGYSHPDAPELTDSDILDRAEIDANYAASQQTVEFLAAEFVPSNPGSRFVDSGWIIDHVAPAEYFEVGRSEIEAMARWTLDHWDGAPPVWVYDGLDYYSIRDVLVLFSMAVAEPDRTTFDLLYAYGPFDDAGSTGAATASLADLRSAAASIATSVTAAATAPWEVSPSNLLDSRYAGLTLAQVLYGLAAIIADPASADPVTIPATASAPGTLGLLEAMGCPTCSGTAWSLKPARIHLDG
jgi:hypothetical protein